MRFILLSAYSASVFSSFYPTYSPTTVDSNKLVSNYRDFYPDSGFLSAPQINTTIYPYTTEVDSFYDSRMNFALADDFDLNKVYRNDYYNDLYHIRHNDPADHLPALDLDEEGRFPVLIIEV